MLKLIGSRALPALRNDISKSDIDMMMTTDEFDLWYEGFKKAWKNFEIVTKTKDYCHIKTEHDNYEIYFGHSNNSTEQLLNYMEKHNTETNIKIRKNVLYAIKMSHRFLKNSPHFLKTLKDISTLKVMGANMDDPELYNIYKLREKETYTYSHPVLNVSKVDFFDDDGIQYVYDHDSIHEAVKVLHQPAYKFYIEDDAEVLTNKEKFMNCSDEIKLLGVYEEACVLALERSQIPNDFKIKPKDSFVTALIKVCTSITSGYFRSYAYDHFYEVIDLYRSVGESRYIEKFHENSQVLRKFK